MISSRNKIISVFLDFRVVDVCVYSTMPQVIITHQYRQFDHNRRPMQQRDSGSRLEDEDEWNEASEQKLTKDLMLLMLTMRMESMHLQQMQQRSQHYC